MAFCFPKWITNILWFILWLIYISIVFLYSKKKRAVKAQLNIFFTSSIMLYRIFFITVVGFVMAGLRGAYASQIWTLWAVLLSAGISQSRISHWLLQQGSDLSEQKKRAFYRWYQLEKTTPGNTLPQCHLPM